MKLAILYHQKLYHQSTNLHIGEKFVKLGSFIHFLQFHSLGLSLHACQFVATRKYVYMYNFFSNFHHPQPQEQTIKNAYIVLLLQ